MSYSMFIGNLLIFHLHCHLTYIQSTVPLYRHQTDNKSVLAFLAFDSNSVCRCIWFIFSLTWHLSHSVCLDIRLIFSLCWHLTHIQSTLTADSHSAFIDSWLTFSLSWQLTHIQSFLTVDSHSIFLDSWLTFSLFWQLTHIQSFLTADSCSVSCLFCKECSLPVVV